MDKEIKFTEKKVDQSWKEEVQRERKSPEEAPAASPETPAGISFANFLTSLGYQALIQLGEAPYPETHEQDFNLDAAQETIDLLSLLEKKTQGNRTPEEDKLLKSLLAQLQMKFVERSGGR